ncbi:MAG TPA: penicillin acylase family protein, partial [Longimicrobiales bacterium]|nr:penicillin acylase family protein [Longimicrobiales bacterium]
MTPVLRRVGITLLVLVVLLLVGVGCLVAWLRTAEPDYDRTVALPGLDAEVRIIRDSLAIPHVFAATERDLLFAQGWVHAQDRLWQMEVFRRVAEGRLAEALGEDLVASDRFLRTLGIWSAAGAVEARLAADARARLQAYADGVNAFIDARTGAPPPEFLLLRIDPEPWTVRHVLAIEKLMAWDLSSYLFEIDLARAVARIGAERARWLAPDYPAWGATILQASEHPSPDAPFEAAIPEGARILLESMSVRMASNAWVIGGARTASGKPILANDMHLPLRAPGIWYLIALHGAGYDIAGMSIPGVPFVVAGHNRAVAWGFTNAMTDDVDFFVERLDPADTTRYLTPDGSEPFRVIEERIRVKGRDEPVVQRVRWTRHGPVISDVTAGLGDAPVALRWAAHDPSRSVAALPAMNRATSAAEFRAALREFENPHQNVVFADTAGDFGYQLSGHVPVRGARRLPPRLPVPGWTGAWDWTGRLPFEEHPAAGADVAAGYIITANNRQAAAPLADLVSGVWETPFRAMRIERMIESARAPLTAAHVHRMQLDVLDMHALRYRDRAIDAARAAGLDSIADVLAAWDARATTDSRIAPVYYAWYQKLRQHAATDLYGGEPGAMLRGAIDHVLELRALPWRAQADGARAFARLNERAMREAVDAVAGRTWGDLH